MSADIRSLSLVELASALKSRRISSVETTRACLSAIEQAQPRLNCFISVEPEAALAQAQHADHEIANGAWRGPLHGVPFAHKDMYYRAGKVSTCGAQIKRDYVAKVTAAVHEQFAAAGALYLGGLNMSEFAASPTGHNEYFGHCRNPWNPAHITGGSSSGSGAAVAARLVYGAMGSDTGGSVRLPAGICGVTGIKPTYGLVSRYGAMPRCWSLDAIGPLARTAEDCALMLRAVAGRDDRDPTTATHAVPDYAAALGAGMRGLKIGVPTNPIFAEAHPQVRAALEASLARYRELGATVRELELPDPRLTYALTNLVNKAEAATIHGAWVRTRREDYSLSVVNRFEAGFYIPATQYLDALRLRAPMLRDFVERVFGKVDVVHMPVLGMPVPTLEETEIHSTARVPELMERVTRYTRWVNILGLPAISVPCGFSSSGLPIAFQLLGRPFSERTLFRAAHAYQQATDWRKSEDFENARSQEEAMIQFLVHSTTDTVGVAVIEGVKRGQELTGRVMDTGELLKLTAIDDIPLGHKIAVTDIKDQSTVVKYGHDIGRTIAFISKGQHVHVHNLKTKRW